MLGRESREGVGSFKRGGSWINNPENCRSAYRNNNNPDDRDNINNNNGFRVMCVGSERSCVPELAYGNALGAPSKSPDLFRRCW
ncbi:MAG: hypothetical protein SAJ12_20005 [Jaaginema sp. PMC 1079.18]|nr:hypothetical protein [Jaaginema sp. PMC 1080.18]MEC4853271.1 hypothetical protein [Jaaginema sp. PMC 1079.18]MEC4867639.1 hypothetical protein [Jaaginema sp. PMC 1078.18]